MKNILFLTFLSLSVASIDVTTKRVAFEISQDINQIDFSNLIGNSEGIFTMKTVYMENFTSTLTPESWTDDNGYTEYWFEQNLGIQFSNYYGSTYCGISYGEHISGCDYHDGGELTFLDSDTAIFSFYENDFEGCSGDASCNWQISGTMYVDITGPFNDGIGSNDEIDDLQAQIDDLVNQLTGCVDCQGDANSNGYVNVSDIIMLVEHIVDIDSGNCFTQ